MIVYEEDKMQLTVNHNLIYSWREGYWVLGLDVVYIDSIGNLYSKRTSFVVSIVYIAPKFLGGINSNNIPLMALGSF